MGRPKKEAIFNEGKEITTNSINESQVFNKPIEIQKKSNTKYLTVSLADYICKSRVKNDSEGSAIVIDAIKLMFEEIDKPLVDRTERRGEIFYTFKME